MNEFEKESLEAHNKYRASHHATPLAWNLSLAKEAQAWADYLAYEDRLKHANTDDGENIYMSFGDVTVSGSVAVDKWYHEVNDYSFSRPGFQSNTGHFTQVVWRGSKELGVAKARGHDGKVFVVARYRPPGNNLRTFEENVLPAQKYMTPTKNHAYVPSHRPKGAEDHYSKAADKKSYHDRYATTRNRYQEKTGNPYSQINISQAKKNGQQRVGNRHNNYINHKWDEGTWFNDEIIEQSVNQEQQATPGKISYKPNGKNTGIATRWQPEAKTNNDKNKMREERKENRNSIDRTKSANKVRLSTEKWESISYENDEKDGRGKVEVGRSRTKESIKRWEAQNFNQPNLPFRQPVTKPIKPTQSKQVYSERWDPLWREKPPENRPRPKSWNASAIDKVDGKESFSEPRKITTTFDEGPTKKVVSSVTIVLKGNDLRRTSPTKGVYIKRAEDKERLIQEVFSEQNATMTNSRPRSEDFGSYSLNSWEGRSPIREALIVPEVKKTRDHYESNSTLRYLYVTFAVLRYVLGSSLIQQNINASEQFYFAKAKVLLSKHYLTDTKRNRHDTKREAEKSFPKLDPFSQQALDWHNIYRGQHGANNLIWSPTLAISAQDWAEQLARERTLRHSSLDRGADGENLAMMTVGNSSTNPAKKAINMWYDEIKNYDFSRPGYQPRCGHFTQLVWKDSRELGMGCAQTSDGELLIVVARYRPCGNVIRNYELNVFPKKKFY